LGARTGPAPKDDAGWAEVLARWIEQQAEQLAGDVLADHDRLPVLPSDIVARARRLWTLAHMRRTGWGGLAVAEALAPARAVLGRHADDEHGGYLWSVDRGQLNDQKLLYGQTAVIHALAELALADAQTTSEARAEALRTLAMATEQVTGGVQWPSSSTGVGVP
jgi:mannose/cellobiose epimerase-like protein (N-acyl-D-glucosamine 2-epimerase family)